MRRKVRVRSTKWDGSLHKDSTAIELGDDSAGIVDEDEFGRHRRLYGYPPETADRAGR